MDDKVVLKIRELRRRNSDTIFKKGFKPYIVLILVIFAFSFLKIINSAATKEIEYLDQHFGVGDVQVEDIEAIQDYVVKMPIVRSLPESIKEGYVKGGVFMLATDHTWILGFLGKNRGYAERNVGEMVAFIIIAFVLIDIIIFMLIRPFMIGFYRYMMESRFQKDVKIRRIVAPFAGGKYWNIFKTDFWYNFYLGLWYLTIVGGFIKYYQYYFVPHILAENPDVTWKQARDLSKSMTKGYKWKMFLTELSYIYLDIPGAFLPFIRLFLATPLETGISIELYFLLRQRKDIDRSLLIETGFDNEAYVDRRAAGEAAVDIHPEYVMKDVSIKGSSFDENDKYKVTEFIIMFFLFSFVGWLWEVGIHVYEDHVFVNRGTMYGPWLPIYGAGGAGIIVFLSRFKNNKPKLFVLTMVLCGILEYATSFFLEFFNNSKYWDYNDMFANLNGRVCLAGLLAFAFGGFLGIYILGPMIKRWVERLGKKRTKILCTVLVTAFVIDMICCKIFGPNSGAGIGEKFALLSSMFGC